VDALELRVRLYGALGRWTDFVEGLGRLAERLEGPAAAVALGQAAEAWENQLVYSDKAVETWRRALLRDSEYVRAYAELGRLLQELGDSEGAFEVLTQGWQLVSAQGATGTDAAEVCTRLALLTDAEGPEAARRMEYLQTAVEADPRHAASREAYELERERSGGIDRLLTLLDEEMQAATSDGGIRVMPSLPERPQVGPTCQLGRQYRCQFDRETEAGQSTGKRAGPGLWALESVPEEDCAPQCERDARRFQHHGAHQLEGRRVGQEKWRQRQAAPSAESGFQCSRQ
jgi:tetratricopeptide (TPR) repeat protein